MKLNYRLKNTIIYLLKISITIGLLIFLFNKIDIKKMIMIIKGLDLFYFSIAAILFVITYFLGILRWQVLLVGSGVKVPLSRVVLSFLMGLAINLFVPSTVGGDLARGVDLSNYSSNSKSKILATVLLDRLSGFVALILIGSFSILLGYKFITDSMVLIAFGILISILLILIFVLFNRKVLLTLSGLFSKVALIKNSLIRFDEAISLYRSKSKLKIIIQCLLLGLLVQGGTVIIFYFIGKSLKLDVGMIHFFIFIPIINAISMVPLTIAGLGLRDTSAVFFFTKVGASASGAFSLSLIGFFLIMLAGIIGGIVYVFTLHPRRIQHH